MRKLLTTTAIVAALALPGVAFANHNFADHDTNGDGTITKAEFTAKAEEKFAKKDTNGDGKITKAEFDAYKAKWQDKHDDDDDDHDE